MCVLNRSSALVSLALPTVAFAYTALPPACDIQTEVDARAFADVSATEGELIAGPTITRDGAFVSSCNLPNEGIFSFGILVRDDAKDVHRSAAEQLKQVVAESVLSACAK